MTVRAQEPLEMSYEAFLEWADEDTAAEWVSGKVILMSPPSDRHQDLADFLTALMRYFAEEYDLGKARSAAFQMKLATSGREPDVLFVAKENLDRIKKNRLIGPADLAVEIISPESRKRDRHTKFLEYEQAGVKEYWLIDPERERADFYRLDERGMYQAVRLDKSVFRSEVLRGLELDTVWLWQEPLPLLRHVLKVWGLI